ncbi:MULTISPECIES: glycoside hydrolase family 88/105 protein [Streptomyces]|uniref:glycoside hydrolase family 88/105 protein n=1 Tax=Streptomyces lycopersici TaxID=2974589 RepID=UPI0021D3EA1C|nr:glycoside hydrolase family 88 protein [Streptomyces sp. NEAU-383]
MISRRTLLASTLGITGGLLLPTAGADAAPADWSRAVVDSTIARKPDPTTLGGWGYTQGLFLLGAYRVYQRVKEPSYLAYIKGWVDNFVDADGHMSRSFDNLDAMQSGNLLLILHQETGDPRYRTAADQIRDRITTYPRTADGGMWHATGKTNELWGDGVFMAQPFLLRYGIAYGDEEFAYEEVTRNLSVYFRHLKAANGLIYHAYDADGDAPWKPDPTTGTSAHFWARAIGWTAMTHVEVLELLPVKHPRRAELIGNIRHLAKGFARYQDPATGRWFQVVDKAGDSGNWTETSASSMYTLMLHAALEHGWISGGGYASAARRGYQGVLKKVSVGSDGLTNITDISEGTNVGDLAYYLGRKRNTNDLHGLGAFLLMNERLAH